MQRWSKDPAWAQEAPARNSDSKRERQVAERSYKSEGRRAYTPFSPGSNNLSLDIGQIFLFGDKGNDETGFSDSIGFQIHNVHSVSDIFGLDTALAFSSHGPNLGSVRDYSLTSLKLGLRANLAWYDKAIPYATFGLGFFRPNEKLSSTESINAILFGLYLGAGVNLEVTDTLFFGASLTLHDMFGTRRAISNGGGTLEVDGGFASFLVSAGVSF
jgi:hypothetical protein